MPVEENPLETRASDKSERKVGHGSPAGSPNDVDVRWWLQVGVAGFRIRALYDPGASRTVMGPIGLQLASACGRTLTPSIGKGARVIDGRSSPVTGYVELPFKVAGIRRDLRVAIMPELDADCYLGVNFVREFQAVLDPCSNQLLIRRAKKLVELELSAVSGENVA